MSLYIDKYQGVWDLDTDSHCWQLISSNSRHENVGVVTGSFQNDATMREEFAPLSQVDTGAIYKFRHFVSGEKVWISAEWFESTATRAVLGINTNPHEFAGVVKEQNLDGPVQVLVTVVVPPEELKKRGW